MTAFLQIQRLRKTYDDVVAIDQPFVINRLGASQPGGMIFVLKDDLVAKAGSGPATFDNFKLRNGKRPRPKEPIPERQ